MNKLEVGMYVRFKDKKGATYIRKLTKLANEYPQKLYGMEIDEEANYSPYLSLENILKASHNIIDLIEVGDVITTNNLCGQVTCIDGNKIYTTCYDGDCCYDYQIQSIVTKEQISSMEYRLGE